MSTAQPDTLHHKQQRTNQSPDIETIFTDPATFAISSYQDDFLTLLSFNDLLQASETCITWYNIIKKSIHTAKCVFYHKSIDFTMTSRGQKLKPLQDTSPFTDIFKQNLPRIHNYRKLQLLLIDEMRQTEIEFGSPSTNLRKPLRVLVINQFIKRLKKHVLYLIEARKKILYSTNRITLVNNDFLDNLIGEKPRLTVDYPVFHSNSQTVHEVSYTMNTRCTMNASF